MVRRRLVTGICLVAALGCTPMAPAAPDADPVVIAAGTGAPREFYEPLASRLRGAGYEVRIYVIPAPLSPFEESAQDFQWFLDDVLDETGRTEVDVIAHSQGVILVRYAAKFLGGGTSIDSLISLSGGIHGSALASSVDDSFDCFGIVLCKQAAIGSEFMTELNHPSDTLPGIHHVNITTIHDQIAVPYTANLMTGPGDVTNVLVQDQCPDSLVDHITLPLDGVVASGIDAALAHRPIVLDCDAR